MIINNKRIKHLQAYKVKKLGEYLYAWHDTARVGNYGACVDVYSPMRIGELPCCHSEASLNYLRDACYPVSFAKLPPEVQVNLTEYIKGLTT